MQRISPLADAGNWYVYGVPEIVNGVGYATRVGGSCPHPDVLRAMSEANTAFVEIDDLEAAASRMIAHCTGAESGLATCGAAFGNRRGAGKLGPPIA